MRQELPIAPEVRPAADLAALAAEVKAEVRAGEADSRKGVEHFRKAGGVLLRAREACGHGQWLPWLKKTGVGERMAQRYIALAKSDAASDLGEQWRIISGHAPAAEGEADDGEPPVPEDTTSGYFTPEQWGRLGATVRKRLLHEEGDSRFNREENASIEWAQWTWNPVTGCEHNCPYCYARDIATLGPTAGGFPNGFAPTFIPKRLSAPRNTRFPAAKAAEWIGHKNVFTVSMGDLFGGWVPVEWVEEVLRRCREAPQWNFLFLTKSPGRMAQFDLPENAWIGTTVDCQVRVANAEKAFRKIKAKVKWVSIEPWLEPLKFKDLGAFQWVVLGGASKSSKTPEWRPPGAWIEAMKAEAARLGVAVYEKENLRRRVRGYPGAPDIEPTEAPKALRYLPRPEGH
jgi:protein gp37